jgi:transcriptional regulator with XRE-family HTH domain
LKTRNQEEVRLDLKAIGRRVREIRGFDLKQTEFAEILGVSQTQLSKYERGKSVPMPEILVKLKRHSRKTIDWILTGE